MKGYLKIQEYEKIMHENAADASIYTNQYFYRKPIDNFKQ